MTLTTTPEWRALVEHRREAEALSVAALLTDRARTARLAFDAAGLRFDLTRHLASERTLDLLLSLAQAADVAGWRARLFAGDAVNVTERRCALHTALRAATLPVGVAAALHAQVVTERERMLAFADAFRAGEVRGADGTALDTVVCVGIGGSDLGPRLVTEALRTAADAPRVRFVANIDPADLQEALAGLEPRRTLLLVVSKSFGTLETLENARAAHAWFAAGGIEGAALRLHQGAVTSRPDRAQAFGVADDRLFTFAEWVGGRYSLWSACGLPIALAHGSDTFRALLAGAAAMDRHFVTAPPATNAPLAAALLGIWYVNFFDAGSRAVLPYAHRLRQLPAYLQQLEMESNGKRVTRDGLPVDHATAAVVWGEVGSNAQHSVCQQLHQGPRFVPVDFVACADQQHATDRRAQLLWLNAVAQADALALGDAVLGEAAEARPEHARNPGNRPSSLIVLPQLDAGALGALLAFYEHRTFVQGVIWEVNSFDQFGVELGKKLVDQRGG